MTHSPLQAEDAAPTFTLPNERAEQITIPGQFQGLNNPCIVLFFYPRDDTSGCTQEAKDFSDLLPDFKAATTVVFGVSKDSVKKHERFRDKHGLTVPLLSDEHHDTCERYGVWGEKKMYGKTFMGIERSTFLIGSDGRILRIWRKVKVPGHAKEVLTAARELP